jgi:hypothetical protein
MSISCETIVQIFWTDYKAKITYEEDEGIIEITELVLVPGGQDMMFLLDDDYNKTEYENYCSEHHDTLTGVI